MSTNTTNIKKPAEESERSWYAPVAELLDVGSAYDFWKDKGVEAVQKADSYAEAVTNSVSQAYHYISETSAPQIVGDAAHRIAQHFPKQVEAASSLLEKKVYPAVIALTDGVEKVVSAPLHHGVEIVKAKVGGFLAEHEQTINPVADFLGGESVLESVKEYLAQSEDFESHQEVVQSIAVPSPKSVQVPIPPSYHDDQGEATKQVAKKTKQDSKKENTKTLPKESEEECPLCEQEAHEKVLSNGIETEGRLVSYPTPQEGETTLTSKSILVETEEGGSVAISSSRSANSSVSLEPVVQNSEDNSPGVIAMPTEENQNQSLAAQTTYSNPKLSDNEDESFPTPSHNSDEPEELFIQVGSHLITGGNGRSVDEVDKVDKTVQSSSRLPYEAVVSWMGESQLNDGDRANNPLFSHDESTTNPFNKEPTLLENSQEPLNSLLVYSGKNPPAGSPKEIISGKQDHLFSESDRAHTREVQSGIVDLRNAPVSAPMPSITHGTLASTDTDARTIATRLSIPLNDVPGSGDKGADSNDRGRDRSTEAIYAGAPDLDESSGDDLLLTGDLPSTYPSVFTDVFA